MAFNKDMKKEVMNIKYFNFPNNIIEVFGMKKEKMM